MKLEIKRKTQVQRIRRARPLPQGREEQVKKKMTRAEAGRKGGKAKVKKGFATMSVEKRRKIQKMGLNARLNRKDDEFSRENIRYEVENGENI
jgi:hypothetical protein